MNPRRTRISIDSVDSYESPAATQKGYEAAEAIHHQQMRLRYVIPALLLIPLSDALLLVVVADYLGWQATVALVVLTGLIGMLLVRAEGRHTLRRIQRKAARAEVPGDELVDGALLVAAGAFLLTPGVVTDAIGFLFAIPLTRYPIRAALKRFVVVPTLDRKTEGFVTGRVWTSGFPQEEDVYDVEGGSYRPDDDGRDA